MLGYTSLSMGTASHLCHVMKKNSILHIHIEYVVCIYVSFQSEFRIRPAVIPQFKNCEYNVHAASSFNFARVLNAFNFFNKVHIVYVCSVHCALSLKDHYMPETKRKNYYYYFAHAYDRQHQTSCSE